MSKPKFSSNKYGIVNSRGEQCSLQYISGYVQCWSRKENGYTENRTAWIAYFMSDAWLTAHPGLTASQIGSAAHVEWNAALTAGIKTPPTAPKVEPEPLSQDEIDAMVKAYAESLAARKAS